MADTKRTILVRSYWALTLLLFGAALAMVALYAPVESTMGPIQKIFYLHLPVAITTFAACLACFVGSIAYLTGRNPAWDDFASASASVAVVLCSAVLITGMVWGRSAWGMWWTWSPRLTFSLVLWLLYVVYLMLRMGIESSQRRAVVSAVYAIIAFLDVPLVFLSVRLMPDIHPSSVQLAPEMKLTLLAFALPVVLLAAGLIAARFDLNRRQRRAAAAMRDAAAGDATANAPMSFAGGAL
jgi:heme exporter protein C